jgi:hypothetical protein
MSTGPYETERDATLDSLWHLRGCGDISVANKDALAAKLVGVERGEYDRRILDWLAGWEPSTVTVICGLIARAHAAERSRVDGGIYVAPHDVDTVLAALNDAAECGDVHQPDEGLAAVGRPVPRVPAASGGSPMTRLNVSAKATLREAEVSQAEWAHEHFTDGRWHGDACGCPDDRCMNGYHHDADEDCGCLPVLLERYLSRRLDRGASSEAGR